MTQGHIASFAQQLKAASLQYLLLMTNLGLEAGGGQGKAGQGRAEQGKAHGTRQQQGWFRQMPPAQVNVMPCLATHGPDW